MREVGRLSTGVEAPSYRFQFYSREEARMHIHVLGPDGAAADSGPNPDRGVQK